MIYQIIIIPLNCQLIDRQPRRGRKIFSEYSLMPPLGVRGSSIVFIDNANELILTYIKNKLINIFLFDIILLQ